MCMARKMSLQRVQTEYSDSVTKFQFWSVDNHGSTAQNVFFLSTITKDAKIVWSNIKILSCDTTDATSIKSKRYLCKKVPWVCISSSPAVFAYCFLSVRHLFSFFIPWHAETKILTKIPRFRLQTGASAVSQTLSLFSSSLSFAVRATFILRLDL